MKRFKILTGAAALAFCLALAGCGANNAGSAAYTQKPLSEGEACGVEVVANNAKDETATTKDALTVKEGDLIILSPMTDGGSFHVTITSSDDKTPVFDDDVSGSVLRSVEAAPGTYDIETKANTVSGSLTVSAQNKEEYERQNAELESIMGESTGSTVVGENGDSPVTLNTDEDGMTTLSMGN